MKRNYLTIILLVTLQFTFAQIVNIPDANFKNALLTHNCADFDGDRIPDGDADTNNDGEIDVMEANAVLGLDLDSDFIDSLEGIASFTSIQFITCINNNLTELDVSQNLNLEYLECRSNSITDLDLSSNTNLTHIVATSNGLNTLTLGSNSNLVWIRCAVNNLSTIDVSGLPNLTRLSLSANQFQTIDVSNNLMLEDLFLQGNQFTTIDISSNPNLKWVDFNSNDFTFLDFSNNPLMEEVSCAFNDLTFLDLSANTNVKTVFCRGNLLTGLDVKNGNNTAITGFNAIENPNLTCINVDDAAYSQSQSTWTKDAIASYDTNCPPLSTEEFQTDPAISLFPNPTSGKLQIESKQPVSNVTVYNLVGQQVKTFSIQLHQNSIDISALKTGSYFVNVQNTSGNTYTKLIVKK